MRNLTINQLQKEFYDVGYAIKYKCSLFILIDFAFEFLIYYRYHKHECLYKLIKITFQYTDFQ